MDYFDCVYAESAERPKVMAIAVHPYISGVPHRIGYFERDGQVSGDVLRITLVAEDRTYSFALDAYRISKRFTPGHPVTFEFRADRAGTFAYYCDLTTDDGYKATRGELHVAAQ